MIYSNVMSGGAKTYGCAVSYGGHVYVTPFGPGDVTYNVHKARKGVLEKVVVKQIVTVRASLVGGLFSYLYKDTFNGLWNADELVTLDVAKDLAIAYNEMLLEQLRAIDPCD